MQELFNSMIAEQSDLRPTFKDIAAACNNYFTSETEASHEIDALVSYVMGSDPEVCECRYLPTAMKNISFQHDTYSEDVDIEEADLEAEVS